MTAGVVPNRKDNGRPPRRSSAGALLAAVLLGTAVVLGAVVWTVQTDLATPEAAAARHDARAAHQPTGAGLPLAPPLLEQAGRLDASRMFELGYGGGLVVDQRTRAALDIVLGELGAQPDQADLAAFERQLRGSLPSEEADKVLELLHRYRDYRKDVQQASAAAGMPASLGEVRTLLERTTALRRQHFDAAAGEALFGEQEAEARLALARAEIESDPRLSEREKLARLQALQQQQQPLPPAQPGGAVAGVGDRALAVAAEVAAMRERGATAEEVLAFRRARLGAEEADYLAQMDAQQADWQRRYDTYAAERRALEAAGVPDASQRQAQVEQLLRRHFADGELAAARAYERDRGR
ncbi:lipase secretion chaperone [Caldimonas brevitalea]|uniref:Lipase helper protein n=1 Tax=Caldimonas brevitalea TaxID=413882 RepID=A0A0G3BLD5_9BURK|nr:lipase secretion chaperone [Caldimonas brevitalea]AKJ30237.1 lipase modulator protein [Caldimonas brevitalea]